MALTTTDKQLPYLALQKEPVVTMQELYIKYPDGGRFGWYAFVKEIGSFAYWDVESKSWKGDKALVFKEEAETARDAALQAQEDSENAKDDAVIAKGQAQEAQTAAEGFAGDAFRSMELSEQAKVAAEKAQGKSEDAQIASETAKGLSETARDQSVAARNEAVNLVSQVGLGTPKGTFTALVDLQTADPDHQYIYLVISDGHWYYWDEVEEEWADGGLYQAALDIVGELGDSETKVVNQKGVTDGIAQLAGEVEQLAYVKIKNEAVNGNFENGLIAPFYKTDGGGGASTLAINSSTPISGNYDIRLTITTPATEAGRPYLSGLHGVANIGDKIYLHFYAKILSGIPIISGIHNGEGLLQSIGGDVINGRNTRIIDVAGISDNLGLIYLNSPSVWDMQMDNFIRINLTEAFGAGNEPTEEEMNLLLDILPVDYFEGEITIPAQKIIQWQQHLINTKASHGYETAEPKTLKQVDDSVSQLAGETSVFYSDKNTFAEAALSIPKEKRKSGLQLTFGGYGNYQIWRNVTGDVLNDAVWSDSTYWIKLDSKVFNLEFEIDIPTTRKKLLELCPKALSMGVIVSYLHPENGLIVEINTDITGGDTAWSQNGWVTIYNASDKKIQINIDVLLPKQDGYYNISDAIISLPTELRLSGIILSFSSDAEKVESYQYQGESINNDDWYNMSLWKKLYEENTLKNLVINSDYRNPYIGSMTGVAAVTYNENIIIATSNGTSAEPRLIQSGVKEISKLGHKYYVSAEVRVNSEKCKKIQIYSVRDASEKNAVIVENPTPNIWNNVKGISFIEFDSNPNFRGFNTVSVYDSAEDSVNAIMEVRNMVVIDLTETYGEENEPELDVFERELEKYPDRWFDGAVSLKKSSTDNNYTDEDKELVKAIPDKVDKELGKGLSTNDFTDNYKETVDSLSEINLDELYIAKKAGEFHSQDIHISSEYSEGDKLVILNFHKGSSRFTPKANDVFFNGKVQNNFSDVRILDKEGNPMPFDIIAHGNYDVLVDETLPRNAGVDVLSDNTLISSFDTESVSISNDGINWELLSPDCGKLVFVAAGDIIYTIKNNKIYRSEPPYNDFVAVLDYSAMDDGDGIAFQRSMVQFSSGELIIGRYQLAWDVKIFRSIDNGLTWDLCYETEDFQHVHGVYVDRFQNPEVCYAGLDGGGAVLRTLDKGLTWEILSDTIQSSDNGVTYSEEGFRIISGETSIVGGHSLIKTKDDIIFYPILSNAKGYYNIAKLNTALYSGSISTNDSQGSSIVRSLDNGETWETIYATAEMNEGGASDGFRAISKATPKGMNVEQIFAGCQTQGKYSSVRIFDGGDNYHAMVILKADIPANGLDIKIESGFLLGAKKGNTYIDKIYADLLYLPLNNVDAREIIKGTELEINSPNWVENKGRKLYEFYPEIRIKSDRLALQFSDDCFFNQPFTAIDLSEGNWTLSFWANIEPKGESDRNIILAFNPLSDNKQFLFLVNHQLQWNTTYLLPFNHPQTVGAKLFTLTCDEQGVFTIYKNSGGNRAFITSEVNVDLTHFKGDLYLFGTPFTANITGYTRIKNADFPVNHVQLINRVLTSEEIGKMFGGDVIDLV